ncbi:MAG: HAD hydrolase-like protein [Gallionellaceae bacterium]|nr:HAD hydrolase-like protein [Gallionellaceae bacterium]
MQNRTIKTIILDLDGPLLDGMQRHYQCYRDILLEHGFAPIPMRQYWEMKRNRVDRRKLLALSNASDLYDEFLASWIQRIEARKYLALDRLQSRVEDILVNWKKSGIRLLLATMRNNAAHLHWQLDKLGIADSLDEVVVVGSGQAGASKSAEIKPLLSNKRLDEVIWIGDTEVDIHAARELGVKVCVLTCGLRAEEYLASLAPDMIEENLSSFATKLVYQAEK